MKRISITLALSLLLWAGTHIGMGIARADDSVSLAPPTATSAADETVFNWKDVPDGQTVPIVRATFNSSGYQLYDNVGERIDVPFDQNNLYVMKFGYTSLGEIYFTRKGAVPVLHVPDGAYLENSDVDGSRWYPFPTGQHPKSAVFLGVAPSWYEYVAMGWYHGMFVYGGYWSEVPWYVGYEPHPLFSIDILIGGDHYRGWDSYHGYIHEHPAPYHPGRIHEPVTLRTGDHNGGTSDFRGTDPDFKKRGGTDIHRGTPIFPTRNPNGPSSGAISVPVRSFHGGDVPDKSKGSQGSYPSDSHTFNGRNSGDKSTNSTPSSHPFNGGDSKTDSHSPQPGGGASPGHTFRGGAGTFGGGANSSPTDSHGYQGGSSAPSHSSSGSPSTSTSDSHSSQGGSSTPTHGFSGGSKSGPDHSSPGTSSSSKSDSGKSAPSHDDKPSSTTDNHDTHGGR